MAEVPLTQTVVVWVVLPNDQSVLTSELFDVFDVIVSDIVWPRVEPNPFRRLLKQHANPMQTKKITEPAAPKTTAV